MRARRGFLAAADGFLYGTTQFGGANQAGIIYRIDRSAIVPVTSVSPTSGPAGGGVLVTVTGAQGLVVAGKRFSLRSLAVRA